MSLANILTYDGGKDFGLFCGGIDIDRNLIMRNPQPVAGTPLNLAISSEHGIVGTIASSVETTINGESGPVVLAAGTNVTIVESPSKTFTINSSGGSSAQLYTTNVDYTFYFDNVITARTTFSIDGVSHLPPLGVDTWIVNAPITYFVNGKVTTVYVPFMNIQMLPLQSLTLTLTLPTAHSVTGMHVPTTSLVIDDSSLARSVGAIAVDISSGSSSPNLIFDPLTFDTNKQGFKCSFSYNTV